MLNRFYIAASLILTAPLSFVPAHAAVVLITQAKANAGNVTPGDTPGFPVSLSRPGSYRLDSNLTVPINKIGIDVTTFDVTIDGAGFRIHGNFQAAIGIRSGFNSTTVQNVSVVGFKNGGIVSTAGEWMIVDNVRALLNTDGPGVRALNQAIIRNSTVSANGAHGIKCNLSCHIEGNNISRNGAKGGKGTGDGVFIDSGTVLGNTIIENKGYGIDGTEETGFGNNTIVGNGEPFHGALIKLHPNACVPAC